MEPLAGLHQPQSHLPRRLILRGMFRVSDRREHEMGADRDAARPEHLLGLLAGELNVVLHIPPRSGAQIYTICGPS